MMTQDMTQYRACCTVLGYDIIKSVLHGVSIGKYNRNGEYRSSPFFR